MPVTLEHVLTNIRSKDKCDMFIKKVDEILNSVIEQYWRYGDSKTEDYVYLFSFKNVVNTDKIIREYISAGWPLVFVFNEIHNGVEYTILQLHTIENTKFKDLSGILNNEPFDPSKYLLKDDLNDKI